MPHRPNSPPPLSPNRSLAMLRDLLHGPLGRGAWRALCDLFDRVPEGSLDEAIAYAQTHLERLEERAEGVEEGMLRREAPLRWTQAAWGGRRALRLRLARTLSVSRGPVWTDLLARLTDHPDLCAITRLSLWPDAVYANAPPRLSPSVHGGLARLEALHLHPQHSHGVLSALLSAPLPALRTLTVQGSSSRRPSLDGLHVARLIHNNASLAALDTLVLHNIQLTDAALALLLDTPHLGTLTALSIVNAPELRGVDVLRERSARVGRLAELRVRGTRLPASAMHDLLREAEAAGGESWALRLLDVEPSPSEPIRLLQHPRLAGLRRIALGDAWSRRYAPARVGDLDLVALRRASLDQLVALASSYESPLPPEHAAVAARCFAGSDALLLPTLQALTHPDPLRAHGAAHLLASLPLSALAMLPVVAPSACLAALDRALHLTPRAQVERWPPRVNADPAPCVRQARRALMALSVPSGEAQRILARRFAAPTTPFERVGLLAALALRTPADRLYDALTRALAVARDPHYHDRTTRPPFPVFNRALSALLGDLLGGPGGPDTLARAWSPRATHSLGRACALFVPSLRGLAPIDPDVLPWASPASRALHNALICVQLALCGDGRDAIHAAKIARALPEPINHALLRAIQRCAFDPQHGPIRRNPDAHIATQTHIWRDPSPSLDADKHASLDLLVPPFGADLLRAIVGAMRHNARALAHPASFELVRRAWSSGDPVLSRCVLNTLSRHPLEAASPDLAFVWRDARTSPLPHLQRLHLRHTLAVARRLRAAPHPIPHADAFAAIARALHPDHDGHTQRHALRTLDRLLHDVSSPPPEVARALGVVAHSPLGRVRRRARRLQRRLR